jgi:hypothetical protein
MIDGPPSVVIASGSNERSSAVRRHLKTSLGETFAAGMVDMEKYPSVYNPRKKTRYVGAMALDTWLILFIA